MAVESVPKIAARGVAGNAVVALAACGRPELERLIKALDPARTEVTAVLAAEGALSGARGAHVVTQVCDPSEPEAPARVGRLREALPGVAILMVVPGSPAVAPAVRRALSIGADGVVLERDLDRTLAPAVLALASGQLAVPRAAVLALQRPQLTYREKQVLTLAISGHTNAEIGARLYLAQSTVKSHLRSAYRRLGVASRREAAALVLDPDAGLGLTVLVDRERRVDGGAWEGGRPRGTEQDRRLAPASRL